MAPRHRAVGCLCASGSSSSSAPTVWCSAFSMSFRWRCLWALWRGWRRFSWAPPSHSRSSSLRYIAGELWTCRSFGTASTASCSLRSAWRHCSVRSPTAVSFCRLSSCRPAPFIISMHCSPWPARLSAGPSTPRLPRYLGGLFSFDPSAFCSATLWEWRCTKTSFSIPRPSPSSARRCSSCLCSSPST